MASNLPTRVTAFTSLCGQQPAQVQHSTGMQQQESSPHPQQDNRSPACLPAHRVAHGTTYRDRLRAIISDFRTQTSLREGCNAILRSDCLHLVQRLQREVKRAMPTVWLQRMHTHGASAAAAAAAAADGVDSAAADEAAAGVAGAKVPPKGAASVAAAAGMSGSSYLPRSLSTKGPHWLKYQSGSGRAMLPASSQDVPAVAVHALATMTASGGVGGVGGAGAGQSIRTPAAVSRSTTVAKVRLCAVTLVICLAALCISGGLCTTMDELNACCATVCGAVQPDMPHAGLLQQPDGECCCCACCCAGSTIQQLWLQQPNSHQQHQQH